MAAKPNFPEEAGDAAGWGLGRGLREDSLQGWSTEFSDLLCTGGVGIVSEGKNYVKELQGLPRRWLSQ